jgi:hypothetical protein
MELMEKLFKYTFQSLCHIVLLLIVSEILVYNLVHIIIWLLEILIKPNYHVDKHEFSNECTLLKYTIIK